MANNPSTRTRYPRDRRVHRHEPARRAETATMPARHDPYRPEPRSARGGRQPDGLPPPEFDRLGRERGDEWLNRCYF